MPDEQVCNKYNYTSRSQALEFLIGYMLISSPAVFIAKRVFKTNFFIFCFYSISNSEILISKNASLTKDKLTLPPFLKIQNDVQYYAAPLFKNFINF